jgi:hypothetical protein
MTPPLARGAPRAGKKSDSAVYALIAFLTAAATACLASFALKRSKSDDFFTAAFFAIFFAQADAFHLPRTPAASHALVSEAWRALRRIATF